MAGYLMNEEEEGKRVTKRFLFCLLFGCSLQGGGGFHYELYLYQAAHLFFSSNFSLLRASGPVATCGISC